MLVVRKFKSLVEHQGFRRYAANTAWMMAEQMLRILAGLLVGIWVARYLGPEQFGLFSYVLAFTALFSGIAKLGLDGIIVRELVNHPEKYDSYLGTAFWLKIAGAFVVMGLMAAIVPFTSNDSTTNLYVFIIAAGLLFQSFEVVEFYFQSLVLAKIISICKVIQLALSSIIKIYLVLTQAELLWFVLVTAFDAMSLAVSYVIAYQANNKQNFYKNFNFKVARRLLNDSWPLIISSVFVMVYLKIDQVMIKEIIGLHEVGIYSAAARLSEVFYFIPTLLCSSVFPAILNARKTNDDVYLFRLQLLYSTLTWVAILIAIVLFVFSEKLIILLFGPEFSESISVFKIHIWGVVFVFISAAFGRYLLAENRSAVNMVRVVLGAIVNVVLNYIFIPVYGVYGAAFTTLISLFIVNYFFDLFDFKLRRQLKMKLLSFVYPFIYIYRLARR